jgi:hypothetical protein
MNGLVVDGVPSPMSSTLCTGAVAHWFMCITAMPPPQRDHKERVSGARRSRSQGVWLDPDDA